MRHRKPTTAQKVLTANAQALNFHEPRKVNTGRRITELLTLLSIDKEIQTFKNILARAERMQRNKNNLFNL
jgi:hypothetical protein